MPPQAQPRELLPSACTTRISCLFYSVLPAVPRGSPSLYDCSPAQPCILWWRRQPLVRAPLVLGTAGFCALACPAAVHLSPGILPPNQGKLTHTGSRRGITRQARGRPVARHLGEACATAAACADRCPQCSYWPAGQHARASEPVAGHPAAGVLRRRLPQLRRLLGVLPALRIVQQPRSFQPDVPGIGQLCAAGSGQSGGTGCGTAYGGALIHGRTSAGAARSLSATQSAGRAPQMVPAMPAGRRESAQGRARCARCAPHPLCPLCLLCLAPLQGCSPCSCRPCTAPQTMPHVSTCRVSGSMVYVNVACTVMHSPLHGGEGGEGMGEGQSGGCTAQGLQA